jgi:hypothetical protein
MILNLLPHVHVAVLGDDVVVLDTVTDGYMCVPQGVALMRPSPERGSVAPPDPATASALIGAGLAEPSNGPTARAALRRPTADVGGATAEPLTAVDVLHLGGALWDLVRRYRGRRLSEVLAFVRHAAPSSLDDDSTAVLRLAGLFNRVVVWLPIPRKCLARSFVCLRFLQRSGRNADWVFGVTTWPFHAHCWLQVGETALDDYAERIVAYEPIMVVSP